MGSVLTKNLPISNLACPSLLDDGVDHHLNLNRGRDTWRNFDSWQTSTLGQTTAGLQVSTAALHDIGKGAFGTSRNSIGGGNILYQCVAWIQIRGRCHGRAELRNGPLQLFAAACVSAVELQLKLASVPSKKVPFLLASPDHRRPPPPVSISAPDHRWRTPNLKCSAVERVHPNEQAQLYAEPRPLNIKNNVQLAGQPTRRSKQFEQTNLLANLTCLPLPRASLGTESSDIRNRNSSNSRFQKFLHPAMQEEHVCVVHSAGAITTFGCISSHNAQKILHRGADFRTLQTNLRRHGRMTASTL